MSIILTSVSIIWLHWHTISIGPHSNVCSHFCSVQVLPSFCPRWKEQKKCLAWHTHKKNEWKVWSSQKEMSVQVLAQERWYQLIDCSRRPHNFALLLQLTSNYYLILLFYYIQYCPLFFFHWKLMRKDSAWIRMWSLINLHMTDSTNDSWRKQTYNLPLLNT